MAKTLPAPGFYRSGDKDVVVLDPMTVSDSGELMTKDGDDARWSPAVMFKPAFDNGPTYVLSAAVFDGRFRETTQEEALHRRQLAESQRDKEAGDASRAAEAEGENGAATAEGVDATSEASK
jgi:hypothetical protein